MKAMLPLLLGASACAGSASIVRPTVPPPSETSVRLHGEATFYSDNLAGRPTASGVRYDPDALTAAHRTLPFGTRLRVHRMDTGDTVDVEVNDRGPFGRETRILDLSHAAAVRLHMLRAGVVPVDADVLEWGAGRRHRREP